MKAPREPLLEAGVFLREFSNAASEGAGSEHGPMSFFKSLGDGAAKKKDDKKESSSWKGGSSDMDALKKKSNSAPQRAIPDKASKAKQGSSNFFDKVGKDINQSLGKIDLFKNDKKTKGIRGGGQSLGGDKPGIVIPVSLESPGPLGMEVEKRKNAQKTAIIAKVMHGSQAELAGLKRGDIVCHPQSNGTEEIMYDQFIAAAKSGRRPLRFDVRRIESSILGNSSGSGKVSADAESRRQAVIAAAEARNNKHKALQKPIPKLSTDRKQANGAVSLHRGEDSEAEETRRAVAKVKQAEKLDAAKLGYDPYTAQAMTSGQARTAQVAMTSGEINVDNAPAKLSGGSSAPDSAPGIVSKPSVPLPAEFEESFGLFVTSNSDHAGVIKSLGIMRKLINNAVTKGQEGDEDTSSKFRRVRLSNPKINESISAKAGAVELMILFGFQLSESDGETYLAFPSGYNGPVWTASALVKMQTYENS